MNNKISFDTKTKFLYPISNCHSQDCCQDKMFHDHLQQFAHQVNYIAGLHENGKLSTKQVYQILNKSWQALNIQDFSEE